MTSLKNLGPVETNAALAVILLMASICAGDEVGFDLPSSIECRDVTTAEYAATHPQTKLIEAKVRISARMIERTPANIVDFEYFVRLGKTMQVQSYLPNTTLESAVAEDNIEVTAAAENSKSAVLDARVAFKPLIVGGAHNQTSKKSESSHYKQIAPRDIVLASGTIEREHGVFFRIRPSRATSLEGGREFAIVAAVPKGWRGDLCTISCSARATKRSLISTSVVPIGESSIQVGMHLVSDAEAAAAVERLRKSQDEHAEVLGSVSPKGNVLKAISMETAGLFTGTKTTKQQQLRDAARKLEEAQDRIETLAR